MKDTKQIIFDAAVVEFANNGYKRTTVRDICKRAKVNVASINYHFESKQNLYLEIFSYFTSHSENITISETDTINSQDDLENALAKWIKIMLARLLNASRSQDKLFFQIAMQEFIFPTEVRDVIEKLYIEPTHNALKNIFSYTTLSEKEQIIKVISLLGKCVFYIHNKYAVEKLTNNKKFLQDNFDEIFEIIKSETMTNLVYNSNL